MSSVSAAAFQAASDDGEAMHELVEERVNASDGRERMPPASASKLDAEQLATLNVWLDEGAPGGTCANAGPDSGANLGGDAGSASTEGLECYRFLAHAVDLKTPFKVGTAVDAYYNFTFAAPWKGTACAVVMRPVIDNDKVIHHWLLFQDDAAGTPSGALESVGRASGRAAAARLGAGRVGHGLPRQGADVGVELPGNTTSTVEYHYNSSDPNALDASGVEICVAQKKPAYAAGLSWLGWDQLRTARRTSCTMRTSTSTTARLSSRRDRPTRRRDHDRVHVFPADGVGEGTSDEVCYLFTMAYPKGALADLGAWGSVAHGGSVCLGQ